MRLLLSLCIVLLACRLAASAPTKGKSPPEDWRSFLPDDFDEPKPKGKGSAKAKAEADEGGLIDGDWNLPGEVGAGSKGKAANSKDEPTDTNDKPAVSKKDEEKKDKAQDEFTEGGSADDWGAWDKEPKEPKELKKPKEPKQPKEPKKPKEPKEPKEEQEQKLSDLGWFDDSKGDKGGIGALVQPVKPVKPVEPVKPVKPVEPMKPVKPVEPVEPVEPVKPVQPVKPPVSSSSLQAEVEKLAAVARELTAQIERLLKLVTQKPQLPPAPSKKASKEDEKPPSDLQWEAIPKDDGF